MMSVNPDNRKSMFGRFLNVVRNDGLGAAFTRTLLYPVHAWRARQKQAAKDAILALDNAEARFTSIFRQNYWGNRESVSGDGSTLANTANLRRELPRLFSGYGIKSVFDAPCGDFNWMRLVVAETRIEYMGGDLVEPLIRDNIARYGSETIGFRHFDIASQVFPKADIWICRDCLFHLSNEDIFRALRRFSQSAIPYILTTTHRPGSGGIKNEDITTGGFRRIDLFAPPFNLPADTLCRIDDSASPQAPESPQTPKDMCLWSREQVSAALAETR